MRTIYLIFGWLIIAAGFSSCSTTSYSPFTQDLYKDYDWDERDLKEIQFFLSEDIILRREYSGGDSEIYGGEITIFEGREREEIIIPRGTPGVFLFSPKSNRFAVSFEERDNDKYLMFGPNRKMGGRYVLLASRWNHRDGVVTYGGEKYRVDSNSAYAALMVDLKRVEKSSSQSRVARGRLITDY